MDEGQPLIILSDHRHSDQGFTIFGMFNNFMKLFAADAIVKSHQRHRISAAIFKPHLLLTFPKNMDNHPFSLQCLFLESNIGNSIFLNFSINRRRIDA